MFERHHMIWQFAHHWGEESDWLPYAKDRITEWRSQTPEEIKFNSAWEIRVACFLMADGLLPPSARKALSLRFLETMIEAEDKRLTLDHLHIKPERRGRKRDQSRFDRMSDLRQLLEAGVPKSEAYEEVAEKHCKAVDTIRREYERMQKRSAAREKS